MYYNTFKKY